MYNVHLQRCDIRHFQFNRSVDTFFLDMTLRTLYLILRFSEKKILVKNIILKRKIT